jgi:RND family efflux transporter MFP subunit
MTNKNGLLLIALFVCGATSGAWWLLERAPIRSADADQSASGQEPPIVTVVRVEPHDLTSTLKIAGEFKPFQDVDVHAKVAGYIRNINVDIGDRVRGGQTLAVLEIPELSAQLAGADAAVRRSQEEIRRAKSTVERARSSYNAAHSAYVRLKQAADARAGLVAQQEVDDSEAKDLESEAQVATAEAELAASQQQLEVAQANQQQYHALAGYSRIVAPFAGVVTNRYADTGALIQAGTSSSTQSMPVVRLAQTSRLRLVVAVPESVAPSIHLADPVKVFVQALNREIEGRVSRFADSLDQQTRTMETEIDFDNRSGALITGMYAETVLTLQSKKNVLTVPLTTVTRNGTDTVARVVNERNEIEERHVQLGWEDGASAEILSGLARNERVVVGNGSQFLAGQKVTPREERASSEHAEGQS